MDRFSLRVNAINYIENRRTFGIARGNPLGKRGIHVINLRLYWGMKIENAYILCGQKSYFLIGKYSGG